MQVMDHGTIDNASLISRIMQLEHERDELRRNAEQSFTLQSGIFSGLDLVSRIQSWRSSELGQELEDCGKKLHVCQMENAKLQEELEEAYSIKSKFAEQLKMEVEKSANLEKEVKYFQGKVAAAFSDRDRAFLEVEKLQTKKDGLIEKVTDLQDRLDHLTSEYTEEKGLCEVLYSKLEKLKEENDLHKKVTEKFWKVQEQTVQNLGVDDIQEKAAVLLQGSEYQWFFQESSCINPQNKGEQVEAENELAICQASLAHLQLKLDIELSSRKQAENDLFCCKKKLLYVTERICKELQQLSLLRECLRHEALSFFLEEQNQTLFLQKLLHLVINNDARACENSAISHGADDINPHMIEGTKDKNSQATTRSSVSSRASSEDPEPLHCGLVSEYQLRQSDIAGMAVALRNEDLAGSCTALKHVQGTLEKPCTSDRFKGKESVEEGAIRMSSDENEALAQALQEKVAALLLLSQQEERHILESNTTFALESQIWSLKQKLIQVTNEKMDALVRLSCTQERCLKLQEQEKTFKKLIQQRCAQARIPGHFAEEASMSTTSNADLKFASSRKAAMQDYLKHIWSRGQGAGVPTSLGSIFSLRRSQGDSSRMDPRIGAQRLLKRTEPMILY